MEVAGTFLAAELCIAAIVVATIAAITLRL